MNAHDEDNDDLPVGRLLSRREVLGMLGGLSAILLVGCDVAGSNLATATSVPAATVTATTAAQSTSTATAVAAATGTTAQAAATATTATTANVVDIPACIARPELTEGPYFVDEKINRSDVRSDTSDGKVSAGAPLTIKFRVAEMGTSCVALAGAYIDIWHCDAAGVYSDTTDRNWGSTRGENFLRGYQVTDANGAAQFTTIYPGWYQGRAVHIHFKIRNELSSSASHVFTSQFFFDETLTDTVHAQQPYAAKGQRTLRNSGDGIYNQGGDQLVLDVKDDGQGGYTATFDIGLQF